MASPIIPKPAGAANDTPQEPFTPKEVRALVSEALRGDQLPPAPGSDELTFLTSHLNTLQSLARFRSTRLPEEIEVAERIYGAIWTLTELMPKVREEYVILTTEREPSEDDEQRAQLRARLMQEMTEKTRADLEAHDERRTQLLEEAAKKAQADLETFDTLMSAAQAFRGRELPLAPHAAVFGPPVEYWHGYARNLMSAFACAVKNSSKEAAYRFIAAVAPMISNEKPALETVRAELKQGRDKSWVKRKG